MTKDQVDALDLDDRIGHEVCGEHLGIIEDIQPWLGGEKPRRVYHVHWSDGSWSALNARHMTAFNLIAKAVDELSKVQLEQSIQILKSASWVRFQTNDGGGGLTGLVHLAEHKGKQFFVRENIKLDGSGFMVSSAERWGSRHKGFSRQKQVLELCCEPTDRERLLAAVAAADALRRPVVLNRSFTKEWAKHELKLV